MENTLKLYAVNYYDAETLEDKETIRTHSREKAEKYAKYLASLESVIYSQVVTYAYSERYEYYKFETLHYFYKY